VCEFLVALGLLQTERVDSIKTASSTLIFQSPVVLSKQQALVLKNNVPCYVALATHNQMQF
jgi:hypothetical protein